MSLRASPVGFSWLDPTWGAALRTGLYTGASLSLVLAAWLLVANRVPLLIRFAAERNLAAAAALAALALVPVIRFLREPTHLLVSGLLAWTLLSLTYRLSCLLFARLADRMGAFHIFVLGAVAFTIAATVAWIGTLLWTVRDGHQLHTR
jgi:hypothetical protein